MSPHAKLFFDLHQNEHMGGTHKNGFTLRLLILTWKQQETRLLFQARHKCALLETNECLECAMAMAHLILLLLNLRNTNALCSTKINDQDKQRS